MRGCASVSNAASRLGAAPRGRDGCTWDEEGRRPQRVLDGRDLNDVRAHKGIVRVPCATSALGPRHSIDVDTRYEGC